MLIPDDSILCKTMKQQGMNIRLLLLSVLTFMTSFSFAASYGPGKDSTFVFRPESETIAYGPSDVLEEGMLSSSFPADSTQHYIDQAHAAIQKIRELNNFITNIDEASKFELPVGISKEIAGVRYDLAITAIRLKPAYAELDVFLQFEVPQNNMTLTFMAKGIKFTSKGGIVGNATLQLVGDYAINMNGDKSQIILKGTQSGRNTFVTIDCDGFKELGLDADVKFSRDLIRPENPNGTVAPGNVTASFTSTLASWNDLVVQLTIPTFQVTGLDGVSFAVQDAVFDFSDLRNAPNVQFPEGYQSTLMLPDNPNLWRGFYMRELTVKLPQEFKKRGSTDRTTFRASNVVIDNMGFTGTFEANNLITLQQGDMNNWAFSLDYLKVQLQANNLVEAGFRGNLIIPIAKDDTPFSYSAVISTGGNYLFNVTTNSNIEFEVFKAAKVDIYQGSYLEIKSDGGRFLPKANLNGKMTVNAKLSEGGQGVELADITFENLQIQTVQPYINVGNFSFGSEALQQKMAGFPISIQDVGLTHVSDTEVGLDFTLKVNLVGEGDGGFAGDASLTVVGKMDTQKGWQSWKYEDIQVHEIDVDIDGGAFKINGRMIFYKNDASYGDGFNGTVKAEFKPGIKVSGTAIFGNVAGMRYWYVDAMVGFPVGIPIFTGVGVYGFGGGAYYHMKIDSKGLGSKLGQTASGVVYIPDTKAGLGLKAVLSFGSYPKPEAFNGDVTFEIAFFEGGGIRYISFGGNGYLVTPGLDLNLGKLQDAAGKMADKVASINKAVSGATKGLLDGDNTEGNTDFFGGIGAQAGSKGSISAHVLISYDFENQVLHGTFEMYINVAGGIIKGVGEGGRAGWAVLHFAPQEWYIYVGTPDDRIGISVGIGSIRANATSYFMVGTKILGSPPPPPEVAKILKMDAGSLDYMSDLNSIGSGAGFAFGAALSITTGDLNFLMFYARFDAGAGFDIMLKNYGDTRCQGSSDRIGINGWYANGQAYAYFDGSIGIRVKVFGMSKKIEILDIGAAAVLQAKLPNPFWMRGIVGGYFSVLGGVVKGNCKFEVTLGQECVIVRDPNAVLDEIQVISSITPADGEKDVNVFTTPQAVFNMKVDNSFDLVDDLSNTKRTFRIHLDDFTASVDGRVVQSTFEWNDDQTVLALNPYEVLPSQKDVVLRVQVSFEELKNGSWTKVVTDGKNVIQFKESKVTSGIAPDYIPLSNIEYSYPIIGQLNFYKNESPDGYVKLKRAQPYLFDPGPEWRQEGRFKAQDGNTSVFDFKYTYSTNLIEFKVPGSLLSQKVYGVNFVNVPANKPKTVDRNVSDVASNVDTGNADNESTVQVSTKKAEGSIEELQEKSILTYYIRTSKYNAFLDKINSLSLSDANPWKMSNGAAKLYANFSGEELFDQFETDPSFSSSSIVFEAIPDNLWYTSFINPLMYDGYPVDGQVKIFSRAPEGLGIPPVRSIYFEDQTDNVINQDAPTDYKPFTGFASLQYYFPVEVGNDYIDMRAVAANISVNNKNNTVRINNLIMTVWKNVFPNDYYRVKASYVLPGLRKVSSEKILPLYFTIIRN